MNIVSLHPRIPWLAKAAVFDGRLRFGDGRAVQADDRGASPGQEATMRRRNPPTIVATRLAAIRTRPLGSSRGERLARPGAQGAMVPGRRSDDPARFAAARVRPDA
jgi:hypothetical protein